MKLFSIDKDLHLNKISVNILGIKFKFSQDKNFIKYLFDKIQIFVLMPKFIKKHKTYINNKQDNIVRRLFITTGNINLINNLAIIEGLEKENSQNDVVVYSGVGNEEFLALQKDICELLKVNKFYYYIGSKKNFFHYLVTNDLTDYDEIYFVPLAKFSELFLKIYPKAKFYITEEGACSIVAKNCAQPKKNQMVITAKYLDKIDYVNCNKNSGKNVTYLEKKDFLQVSEICEKKYPLEYEINKDDRMIIFCGTFAAWKGAGFDELLDHQNDIINKLVSKGYKILFKPHPRDTYDYKENDSFRILKTKLSLECYSLKNVFAMVTVYSSTSLHMYHYHNIPSFISVGKINHIKTADFQLLAQYAPDIQMLLDIDTNVSAEELKDNIQQIYKNWLDKQPMLSENQLMLDYYERTYRFK